MKESEKKFDKAFRIGIAFMLCVSVVLLAKTITDKVRASDNKSDETSCVYIVYTDENSHPYAVLTNPRIFSPIEPEFDLTSEERDRVAEIVAGQAVGKSVTCQTMIANVMYNQMLIVGGEIDQTEYAKYGTQIPTEETYEAVDAIFERGEWLLDDTVRWTGDAENPDAWHQSLRFVTDCEGIAFYEVR